MARERGEGSGVGQPSSAAAGGELDRAVATTESPNLEWGKAACSEEDVEKWTAADVFRPGELVEWRCPTKDEVPSPSIMEDHRFVILSLPHIVCGLRTDASDFLVSVLAHYGIEWSHLGPNSMTVLSIFAHLCEAYLGVPPTLELFTHFYRLYPNNKGETITLGGVYLRQRDNKKRSYPVYYFKAPQPMWSCMWFYAKLPQSCPLSFKCDALKETNNWKDVLPLSPEQEKQVLGIEELSNQGLTGADIVQDYLKHQISPLRRRAHLACNYTGPTDPTRDSDKDLSEEDIESKLSCLLYLKKTRQKEPPRSNQGLTGADTVLDYLKHWISPLRRRAHLACNYTGPTDPNRDLDKDLSEEAIESKLNYLLDLKKTAEKEPPRSSNVPASLIRASADERANQPLVVSTFKAKKIVVSPPTEIDSSLVRDHSDLEDEILEARPTITTAASADQGVEQKSTVTPAEIEEGEGGALVKPISSIIRGKRKFYPYPSGFQRKSKQPFISTMTKTRMTLLDSGHIKGTSLAKETAVALTPQSPRSARPSSASSVENGEERVLFIVPNVVDQNKVAEDSVSNVLLDQHVRDSSLNEVVPAQSIAERVQLQGAVEESAPILVPIPEEINSDVTLERMQKVQSKFVSASKATMSELLEQALKLVIENKRMKDTVRKAEEALERKEENTKLRDEIRDLKKKIDELNEQNEATQVSLGQKCREVIHLKKQTALLMKDKEVLQSRVSRVNELLKLMHDECFVPSRG